VCLCVCVVECVCGRMWVSVGVCVIVCVGWCLCVGVCEVVSGCL
jgi:hypothetical protein